MIIALLKLRKKKRHPHPNLYGKVMKNYAFIFTALTLAISCPAYADKDSIPVNSLLAMAASYEVADNEGAIGGGVAMDNDAEGRTAGKDNKDDKADRNRKKRYLTPVNSNAPVVYFVPQEQGYIRGAATTVNTVGTTGTNATGANPGGAGR